MLNIEYKENLEEEFYKIIDDEFNKFAVKNEVVIQNNKIDLNSNNVLVDFINTRKYFSYERDEN